MTRMKILIMFAAAFCFLINSQAQNANKKANITAIKVGEKMPDIPLGTVINNHTGKTRFSEFRGKLIILDFWNTHCQGCIAHFPVMSSLQKKFGDRIQIFLVNHEETQEEITKNLPKYKHGTVNVIPADLPSIVSRKHGDNVLNKLFPPAGVTGYHIWIDANGIVRLRGDGILNTYEKKIQDLLDGKEISYITDEGANFLHNKTQNPGGKYPLYEELQKVNGSIVQYNSVFTKIAPEIANYYGADIINYVDTVSGTIRNSFYNRSILQLYTDAVQTPVLKSEWQNRGGCLSVEIIAKDKTKYSADFLPNPGRITDEWMRENIFCYEQTTPLNFSEQVRKEYMLEDLNRFFGGMYGTVGQLEKRKISCWLIVRNSNEDKLKTKSNDNRFFVKNLTENGKQFVQYQNASFQTAVGPLISQLKIQQNCLEPIINETGYSGMIDIVLPEKIKSLEELREALRPYGLDIIKKEKEINVLVIKENGVLE